MWRPSIADGVGLNIISDRLQFIQGPPRGPAGRDDVLQARLHSANQCLKMQAFAAANAD
jgi:hypothetical protein